MKVDIALRLYGDGNSGSLRDGDAAPQASNTNLASGSAGIADGNFNQGSNSQSGGGARVEGTATRSQLTSGSGSAYN